MIRAKVIANIMTIEWRCGIAWKGVQILLFIWRAIFILSRVWIRYWLWHEKYKMVGLWATQPIRIPIYFNLDDDSFVFSFFFSVQLSYQN